MNWNDLRAMWVNGERMEVLDWMRGATEQERLRLITEGVRVGYLNIDTRGHTHSGDLIDLLEILENYYTAIARHQRFEHAKKLASVKTEHTE